MPEEESRLSIQSPTRSAQHTLHHCPYNAFDGGGGGVGWGGRDGAVVRALASHQCGPGSIPGLGVIYELSLLLVLVPASRDFLRVLRFSPLLNQHLQIPIRSGKCPQLVLCAKYIDTYKSDLFIFFMPDHKLLFYLRK